MNKKELIEKIESELKNIKRWKTTSSGYEIPENNILDRQDLIFQCLLFLIEKGDN